MAGITFLETHMNIPYAIKVKISILIKRSYEPPPNYVDCWTRDKYHLFEQIFFIWTAFLYPFLKPYWCPNKTSNRIGHGYFIIMNACHFKVHLSFNDLKISLSWCSLHDSLEINVLLQNRFIETKDNEQSDREGNPIIREMKVIYISSWSKIFIKSSEFV